MPVSVAGDFNIDRDSAVFVSFIEQTMPADVFEGKCPPTFRAEYLPPGKEPRCIDFILAGGEVKVIAAEVVLAREQAMRGGPGYISDHFGLCARLHFLGA